MKECLIAKSVPKRHYTVKYKTEAATLALSVGQHEGACRIGVPAAMLGNSMRRQPNLKVASAGGSPSTVLAKFVVSEMAAEITHLRKKFASANSGALHAGAAAVRLDRYLLRPVRHQPAAPDPCRLHTAATSSGAAGDRAPSPLRAAATQLAARTAPGVRTTFSRNRRFCTQPASGAQPTRSAS